MWLTQLARTELRSTKTRCRTYATASTAVTAAEKTHAPPPWRSSSALDDWVEREARPISLRQLTVFGRSLTEARLLSSANYVRTELPTRIAHRLRNMQTLPYSALTNRHIKHVYEVYYNAFDQLRKVPEIRTLNDNDQYCDLIRTRLKEHLSVIHNLAKGVIEVQHSVPAEDCDHLMITLLRSLISRTVIAEQHLALTETFHEPWHFPNAYKTQHIDPADDFIGEIFLKCNAAQIITECGDAEMERFRAYMSPHAVLPQVVLQGNTDVSFPYLPSHLRYIIGELLRNSFAAVATRYKGQSEAPPIEVLICEAAQHIIIRVSDRGGGIPLETLPHLWSFAKGPTLKQQLDNLAQTPEVAAALGAEIDRNAVTQDDRASSLDLLASRPPDAKLGMGLPISRICAEYWAGSLQIHSLEGYGTDAFLQVSRLGNKNETLSTRAAMDAL